uniref:Uncharacterized protein n=1 Tax=Siphoviridae sp. cttFh17 TaxID=2826491 RepID=A0A8S5NJJ2_9CAUD|nr:MAG TPA: hypothetical protein [Siphoviridae sp. cttFh17]
MAYNIYKIQLNVQKTLMRTYFRYNVDIFEQVFYNKTRKQPNRLI